MVHLLDLPSDILQTILRVSQPWHAVRSDGKAISPPTVSAVCKTFLQATQSGPKAIRCSGLRLVPSTWTELRALTCAGCRPIDALAVHESNIRIDALEPLLQASTSLQHLSIFKCHSLQLPLDALAPTVGLASLALACMDLGSHPLGRHRQLRFLSLVECVFSLDDLLSALPQMDQLCVLMLGGAKPHVSARLAAWTTNEASSAELGKPAQQPSYLRVVEVTFLEQWDYDVVQLLQYHCPSAQLLDFCKGADEVEQRFEQLVCVLASSLGAVGCSAADEAARYAVNCRAAQVGQSPLHYAGDTTPLACFRPPR